MAQITLNSTGVASSGSLVLQSNGTTAAVTIDTSQRAAFVAGTAAAPAITTSGDTDTGIFFPAANTLAFSTNGTEDARFDSSGNLGLGVTPSASYAGYKTFQIASQGVISSDATSNGELEIDNNAYRAPTTATLTYINTAAATKYAQYRGEHRWFNAPSGTAGNAITFTQAMTLDASGNLGVGTSSPSTALTTARGSIFYGAGDVQFRMQNASTGTTSTDGALLAIDSSQTFYLWNYESANLIFGTANTERARIDSSGNLLVGTTSGVNHKLFKDSAGGISTQIYNSSTNTSSSAMEVNVNYVGGTSGWFMRGGDSSSYRFYIYTNGNITNTNNSYGAISDIKLKENITDATPKLAQLNQIRVVNYNFIGSEQKQLGVIAQELEQVFPSMVEEAPDKDKDGNDLGTTTKSVKYSVFVPMLIKAIQEQQAIIQQLQADVAALKGQA